LELNFGCAPGNGRKKDQRHCCAKSPAVERLVLKPLAWAPAEQAR